MTQSKPSSPKRITKSGIENFKYVFGHIRPYRWYFASGLFLLIFSSALFMLLPAAAGEMANAANGESNFNYSVRQYGLFFLVLLISQALFSYVRTICFAIVSEKGMADIRKKLYNTLITKPLVFFEENRVGEITSRITTDIEKLQNALSITLAEFIRQIITLILGIAILAWLAPKLSWIMLTTFPIVVILVSILGRFIRKLSRERQKKLAATNTIVDETFQAFSMVKAYTNEALESLRYGKSVDEVVKLSLKFARIKGIFFVAIITGLFGCIIYVLWRGAMLVEDGTMPVGNLFSFILYTGIIGGSITHLSGLYTQILSALGASERVVDILRSDVEIDLAQDPIPSQPILGAVRFDQVCFEYPTRKDVQVLQDVSINIPAGGKIALVGPSGGGKSTIAKILFGFYPISEGQILIDGSPITAYDKRHLRSQMAIVPQEVILFGGTILENIRYGNPEATDEEIHHAAEQANALNFIQNFPEGFNTIVGDRGIKLSGGQKQRIAIARAILRDPKILILDEATSSLDSESERLVQDALNTLMNNRTSIIIAHRLSTIREADCIYVVDHGKIIESGHHDDLINNDQGIYHHLAVLQA